MRRLSAFVACGCVLLLVCAIARAQESPFQAAEATSVTDGWQLHPIDDSAQQGEGWIDVDRSDRLNQAEAYDYGVVWLRQQFDVPTELRAQSVSGYLELSGSAQLFVDGTLAANFGVLPGPNGRDLPFGLRWHRFTLPDASSVEITIRYDASRSEGFGWYEPAAGVRWTVGRDTAVFQFAGVRASTVQRQQMFLVGLFLGQAALHLLLFLFAPSLRSNLWFSITTLGSAGLVAVQFEKQYADAGSLLFRLYDLWGPLLFLTMILMLRFAYEVFERKLGIFFWGLTGLAAFGTVLVLLSPHIDPFTSFGWLHLLILIDCLRITFRRVKEGWPGGWIIGLGFVVLLAGLGSQFFFLERMLDNPTWFFPVAYYGVAGLLLSVSTYLSYTVARMGRVLTERLHQVEELSEKTLEQELLAKEQETERRLLESDNARKTEELEDARDLQLSLLPRELPSQVEYDIAVSMRTASEVGGDFYDFHFREDRGLTLAIGDATGHGARAGSIVALMKGMFTVFGAGEDLTRFLTDANHRVRGMSLGGAQMAMALARFTPRGFRYSSAGMPPAFVVRREDNSIEELMVAGMPLGGIGNFPYSVRETDLGAGDVVVFLSDGVSEAVRPDGAMLGYEKVDSIIRAAATSATSADEIVAALNVAVDDWRQGEPFADDVTFVVVRIVE